MMAAPIAEIEAVQAQQAVQFFSQAVETVVAAAACLAVSTQQLQLEPQEEVVSISGEPLRESVQVKPRRNGKMRLVAHRGSSHTAPENTLASLKLAFAQGAAGVEYDIQKSADGELFLLHDDTLRRTASICRPVALQHMTQEEYELALDKNVSELSYHDFIRHVDVGLWKGACYEGESPCLMTEAMAAIPDGCFCLCEVKGGDQETAQAVTVLTRDRGWTAQQLTFIGFDLEVMKDIKASLIGYGLSSIDVIFVQEGKDEGRAMEQVRVAKEAGLDGVDFEADPRVVTPDVVRLAAELGLMMGVWVWDQLPLSDTSPTASQLELHGVDFFTSDLPPDMHHFIRAC